MTPSHDAPADPRLDDRRFLAASDRSGMLSLVESFPAQFRSVAGAIPGAAAFRPAEGGGGGTTQRRRLWVAAMGGSAFAADMTGAALGGADLDLTVVRGYALPRAARQGDLLLALSYSGNTAETLSVFEEAGKRGLTRAAISSGGKLAALAGTAQIPFIRLPGGYPPRAAAGLLWTAAAGLLSGAEAGGVSGVTPGRVEEHLRSCRDLWGPDAKAETSEAKIVATRLHGRVPVVYGGAGMPEAAVLRWRTQLNENAKVFCHGAVIPELDHNEVVGWTDPGDWRERAVVVFLENCGEDQETVRRLSITREWLAERGVATLRLSGNGDHPVLRLWWICHLSDYVSVYLAALRGIDPTPVPAIDELKRRNAKEHP